MAPYTLRLNLQHLSPIPRNNFDFARTPSRNIQTSEYRFSIDIVLILGLNLFAVLEMKRLSQVKLN